MPKGKQEYRWSQRKTFRLECLEDRVALSVSDLLSSSSLFNLALGNTISSMLQQYTLPSWGPTPGEGGKQDTTSKTGSGLVQQTSNSQQTTTKTSSGHHHANSGSGKSKSSTLTAGNNKDTTTKTNTGKESQSSKSNTTGSAGSTSTSSSTTSTTTHSSTVQAPIGPVQSGSQTSTENKTDSHLGMPTDKGDMAGSPGGSSKSSTEASAGVASPANGSEKTTIPYLAPDTDDGNKSDDGATVVLRKVGVTEMADPSTSGRSEMLQLDGRRFADFTALGHAFKWVENDAVNVTVPVTRGISTGTATTGQETEEQDANLVEPNLASDLLFRVLPVGAAQLLDQLPVDAKVVDQAMQQLMHQLDNLGSQLSSSSKGFSMLGWAVLGTVATVTLRTANQRRRKKRRILQATGLSNDSLSWMTDAEASD